MRLIRLLLLSILVCWPSIAFAVDNYQRITDMSPAVSLTFPATTAYDVYGSVLIQAESGDIRWRNDGTAPTSTTGVLLTDGDVQLITERLSEIQLWSTDGTANANIVYNRGDTLPTITIAQVWSPYTFLAAGLAVGCVTWSLSRRNRRC